MTDEQIRELNEKLDFLTRQNNLLFLALQQIHVLDAVWDDDGNAVGLNHTIRTPMLQSGITPV